MRFNPPPGWQVPPGFVPDAAWSPDPSWPPAPPAWRYWVEESPATAPTDAVLTDAVLTGPTRVHRETRAGLAAGSASTDGVPGSATMVMPAVALLTPAGSAPPEEVPEEGPVSARRPTLVVVVGVAGLVVGLVVGLLLALAARSDAQDATAAAEAVSASASTERDRLTQDQAQLESDQADLTAGQGRLAQDQATLTKDQATLKQDQDAAATREQDLDQRDKATAAKEKELSDREAAVAAREQQAPAPGDANAQQAQPPATAQKIYWDCGSAQADGIAPMHRGDAGFNPLLDPDGDGVECG